MAVNDLTFNQLSTVLNGIVAQATGTSPITPTNTAEFVTVAQMGLKAGYDVLNTAISQVLSKTIFSVRPYTAKFKSLQMSEQRYGNHVRKLQMLDSSWSNDDRLALVDGESVDQQIVKKPETIQTNFYGSNVYQKQTTVYRDQLDMAFTGPDEFQRFIAMQMQNISDQMEQAHENTARATLANLIGGVISIGNTAQVVHLLAEYNAITGLTLDSNTVYQPTNYAPFMKWVYGRIAAIADMLTERSIVYHANLEGKPIMRHTPQNYLNVYLFSRAMHDITSRVLADTYHDNFLKLADHETVNYWQSIDTPDTIKVKPVYFNKTDGSLTTAAEAMTQANIFGVMFDDEAAGYVRVNQWSAPAPFNARGGYQNTFWHFTDRYFNDFTENAVVLLMD